MRYTPKQLETDLADLNLALAASGSTYFIRNCPRYELQAVDLHIVEASGGVCVYHNIEMGTSHDCYTKASAWAYGHKGYRYPQQRQELTRKQARVVLEQAAGIDFSGDFHTLDPWRVAALVTWAKLTEYRVPRTASGSTARYFFQHLARIKP